MNKAKSILSWKPNWSSRGDGGRWCKRIDRSVHYFGHAPSRSDKEARRAAEKQYHEFMRQRQASAPVKIRLPDATVAQVCEKYLQQLMARHERGEVTASHFEHTRCCLSDFTGRIGPSKLMSCVGELELEDYRNLTLSCPISQRTGRSISVLTAKGRLKAVRALFRWAWKMHILDNLPRNIDDIGKLPNGTTPEPEPKPFTLDELKQLWQVADSRTRCFIALGLNVGMYQGDISDLRNSFVDWDGGYIDRPRCKTKIRARHKIWDITLDLMKQHCWPNGGAEDRVFLTNVYRSLEGEVLVKENKEPRPLVRRVIENGKFSQSDAVKNAFDRALKKIGINGGRGFSSLRDTGACLVEQIDPAATEMYLSHSEPGMKRHYAQRDWARLERALVEMQRRLRDSLV